MSACDPSDDAYNPPLRRDPRGLASRLCRRLMITVLWVALPFVFSAGLLVIYENPPSRFCNGQLWCLRTLVTRNYVDGRSVGFSIGTNVVQSGDPFIIGKRRVAAPGS